MKKYLVNLLWYIGWFLLDVRDAVLNVLGIQKGSLLAVEEERVDEFDVKHFPPEASPKQDDRRIIRKVGDTEP